MGTKRSWDDLFKDRRFHWEGPDDAVVDAAARWWSDRVERIHDLGCGAGRHMAFLQSEGFTVIGSDVSPRGLAACAGKLEDADLPRVLALADMSSLPFADGGFDATISINVLNHGSRAKLQQAADEIRRTLRPGGEVLLTVLNTWDWRFGSGEESEPNSWVLGEGPEAGILHHFFDETDLRDWLSAFEIIRLNRTRELLELSTAPGDRPVHRDAWRVLARRQCQR
ncbi:MAG: class I SAM-dependent methyltransferase [Armatimonadota bacterium]